MLPRTVTIPSDCTPIQLSALLGLVGPHRYREIRKNRARGIVPRSDKPLTALVPGLRSGTEICFQHLEVEESPPPNALIVQLRFFDGNAVVFLEDLLLEASSTTLDIAEHLCSRFPDQELIFCKPPPAWEPADVLQMVSLSNMRTGKVTA